MKKSILQKSFVQKKNNEYFIPNPDIKRFKEITFDKIPVTAKLSYSSLLKFYLYVYLSKYTGKDAYVKYFIDSISEEKTESIEIFNRLPINNGVLSTINKKYDLNFLSTSDTNLDEIVKFDDKISKIINDYNIRLYTDIVRKLSKTAQDSEDVARIMLRHLWRKSYEVYDAHEKGIDLWRLNKETGERSGIKIKSISESSKYRMKDQNIIIEPTLIEISNYNSNFENLPFDYLVFFDRSHKALNYRTKKVESVPQIHILKANSINQIMVEHTSNKKKRVNILLKNWALNPEYTSYQTYNVPFKFTGKKFL